MDSDLNMTVYPPPKKDKKMPLEDLQHKKVLSKKRKEKS